MMARARHRSSATPLALAYTALIVYASLYPFIGWRWPPGTAIAALVVLPWPPWNGLFDLWSNFFGYLPLGLLVTIAARRSGMRMVTACVLGLVLPAILSYCTEVLQEFVPGRVPSLKDFAMNTGGAATGCLLAVLGQWAGLFDRWHQIRERWITRDGRGALALLALWPIGLLFPSPLPLGLGQIGDRLRELALDLVADVPWAETAAAWLAADPVRDPLGPLAEASTVALGLLAPCLVAYSVVSSAWRRAVMALGALTLGAAGMTLSTLLNFGPTHGLAWLTPNSLPGLIAGLLLALLLVPLPTRLAPGLGLMALTGLVMGIAQAPTDPYFAESLQGWEQGRFIRFHGLAQWIGWLWPYVAMLWLLSRLGARRDAGR